MSKEVNIIKGRLKNLYETAVVLDTEMVDRRKDLFELQKDMAQKKKEGATKEELKEDIGKAVRLNTKAALVEQNLHMIMSSISELKFIAETLKVDFSEFLNEEGTKILNNISESSKPLFTIDDKSNVVAVNEDFVENLLQESVKRATEGEGLQRNFDSLVVE